ncbi:hypothetical protein EGT07_14495 [Herbaspirillum sp. HC18]|nr:hypothetical protein EGT07_14495 [Herbaspirillum sp. HC18]
MKLSRRSRVVAALFALVSVLFMQLAMAAYACPAGQLVQISQAHASAMAASDYEEMDDCDGMMDDGQPALCYTVSQVADQSLNKPPAPDLPPAVAVVLVPVVIGIDHSYRPVSIPAQATWLTRDTSPPLSIRNCCFRI